MRKLLSKSRYLNGLQCEKLLWYRFNAPDAIPSVDGKTKALFNQGNRVGEIAKLLFPGGEEIAWNDWEAGIARSIELLPKRLPLFEAGFTAGDLYARADVLEPVEGGPYDLIEVKSSTAVKQVHLEDVAFQRFVYQAAGIPIRNCAVMHIDTNYERNGEIEPAKLFRKVDVTRQTERMLALIPARGSRMLEVARSPVPPVVEIGPQCKAPYDCPMLERCWPTQPPGHVGELYRDRGESDQLIARGVYRLADIPGDFKLSDRQAIQVTAARSGQAHVDPVAIKRFLSSLLYPVFFLDFETLFLTAVPVFDRSRPYEQVPFQYSLDVVAAPGAPAEHHEYLFDGSPDPRPEILSGLKALLGKKGSVVAYSAGFELGRLRECAARFPEYAPWVDQVAERLVDLLAPFQQFVWYHPDQRGSCSLKQVLPAMTGKGYDEMEIGDGATAALRFMDMAFGKVTDEERVGIRKDLLEYCALDTRGTVDIVEAFRQGSPRP